VRFDQGHHQFTEFSVILLYLVTPSISGVTTAPADPAMQGAREIQGPFDWAKQNKNLHKLYSLLQTVTRH
jgi:hypothetical protein